MKTFYKILLLFIINAVAIHFSLRGIRQPDDLFVFLGLAVTTILVWLNHTLINYYSKNKTVKESWNREELNKEKREIAYQAWFNSTHQGKKVAETHSDFTKWIEQNL